MAFIKRRRVQSACSISLREMLSLSSLSTPWVARKLYTNIANFRPQQVLCLTQSHRAFSVHP
jgi:hypothetical protein